MIGELAVRAILLGANGGMLLLRATTGAFLLRAISGAFLLRRATAGAFLLRATVGAFAVFEEFGAIAIGGGNHPWRQRNRLIILFISISVIAIKLSSCRRLRLVDFFLKKKKNMNFWNKVKFLKLLTDRARMQNKVRWIGVYELNVGLFFFIFVRFLLFRITRMLLRRHFWRGVT